MAKRTPKVVIPKLLALDLGCGEVKISVEYLKQTRMIEDTDEVEIKGVDFYTDKADIKHNLTHFPYPFKNNSVDVIYSSHFVEHLDGIERIAFFNECYRILKPNGKMKLIHPYHKSDRAVQDPTHKFPPICETSYLYWTKAFREANKLGHYLGDCNFDFNIYYTFNDGSWLQKNEETRNFAITHYSNVVADMIVDLTKK